MRRWVIAAALLLLLAVGPAALPVDDAEDCRNGLILAKTDLVRAMAACRRLAGQGDAAAQHNLGVMYARGEIVPRDYAEAAKWYLKAAAQGHARAESRLGNLYYGGKGVPLDLAEAARWYRKAADHGEPIAQWHLGLMYADGQGVPQDDAEARRWLEKSARQGYAGAQNVLGSIYAAGRLGASQDLVQAYLWWNLAASQGDADAPKGLAELATVITPAQVAEARKLIAEWKPSISQ